ncbi:MAG TPA: hypothetical protein VI751_15040 [Actinomycetota bacterium]
MASSSSTGSRRRQARSVAGSVQPSRDATAAPSASTSAVDRHPYQGTADSPP